MTNKEKIISDICISTGINKETVTSVFEIINEYDWKVFCSQMGDYDHPGERIDAENNLNVKMKAFPFSDGCKIVNFIKGCELYHKKFHELSAEYKPEE